MDGGFALITGESGLGKSTALRILAEHLRDIPDVSVGVFSRPQSRTNDFYRELGGLFDIDLKTNNRWGGYMALRNKWRSHLEAKLFRPVLLIDEAQEMDADVLSELRLMTSDDFDTKLLLTVIFCGDYGIFEKFKMPRIIPLANRIRTRLVFEPATKEELTTYIKHALKIAGNSNLMTPELIHTVVERSGGNYRALMILSNELLTEAIARDQTILDEKLYLDIFSIPKRKSGVMTAEKKTNLNSNLKEKYV